jgi:hypothetical protein
LLSQYCLQSNIAYNDSNCGFDRYNSSLN